MGELVNLDALADGPRRLLELLHGLALEVLPTRAYPITPSQIVMHLSGELLAAALGVHRVTAWRWTTVLAKHGLVHTRPHKATTTHRAEAVTRNTGTLYAVSLQPGHRARLRYAEIHHEWRDLEADRKAGNTAYRAVQQSPTPKGGGEWLEKLRVWAVTPGQIQQPVISDDCCTGGQDAPRTVQDVVYLLPLVVEAHPTKRPALVGSLASTLARALDDQHSRRWYCRLIWEAFAAEVEGRGGLQVLAAQLARLDVDRRPGEWANLRNPAALLVARLKVA